MTKKPKETIGGKEICGAMFCLLAVLIYLREEVSKNGCQSSCPVERKGNFISVNAFLYFMGKKSKKCKTILSFQEREFFDPKKFRFSNFYLVQ